VLTVIRVYPGLEHAPARTGTPRGARSLRCTSVRVRAVLTVGVALATCAWPRLAGAASEPGPALAEPLSKLDAAMKCGPGIDRAVRDPVLLVSGAAATAEGTWSFGYGRVLPAQGFPTCTVELPERGYGDAQTATEYVVHAVRRVVARSGRDVALIGHSQAALEILWALRFWPDLAPRVFEVVTLAGAWNGSSQADVLCANPAGCFPAGWQLRPGSRFVAAAHREPLPLGPDYTSIATRDDEVVTPQPQASHIDRGRNVLVQDVCPGRPVDHVGILADAAAYAVVLDALTHDGSADPGRVDRSVCAQFGMPGGDPVAGFVAGAQFLANLLAGAGVAPARSEPPLRCYADRGCPRRPLEGRSPAVSPDGATIAFVHGEDIHLAAADGTALRRLVTTRGADDDPGFSPDGSRVVWARRRDRRCDVLTAHVDGSGLRRVTSSRAQRCHPAFARQDRIVFVDARRPGEADLYVVRDDGRGRRRLTATRRPEAEPTVSRTGLLAFTRPPVGATHTHIYTMPVGGGRARRLTGGRARDRDPAFSADGRRVAFSRTTRNRTVLRSARLGGAGSRRIQAPPGRTMHPAYFPDGSVVFARVASRGARSMLWRTRADGRFEPVGP
jgi:triacylglycerol lipase